MTRLWPYVGATKRITLVEARSLGPRWVVQEKHDGILVRLHLNSQGRVHLAFTRSERAVPVTHLGAIRGALLGRPHAVLIGELEAGTEAGVKAATDRGQPLVHLFDALHDGDRSLARLPYGARRDALWRMWAEAESVAPPSHRDALGRFSRARGVAVAPIVAQRPLSQLDASWGDVVVDGEREGLVLVNIDAPAGARASKLKLKPFDTLDARAVSVSRTTVTCEWRGSLFNLGRGRNWVELGDVVEVRHCGWYSAGQVPRFPALVRVRRELQ